MAGFPDSLGLSRGEQSVEGRGTKGSKDVEEVRQVFIEAEAESTLSGRVGPQELAENLNHSARAF